MAGQTYSDLKERLTGCVYTIFTPFDDSQNVDYEALERYLTHIYRTGGRRFYAMAYNSRYSQLRHSEIMALNEFCIRIVKRLDPDNIAIVGDPIHCSTAESTEFTRHAKECGADFVSLIVREKYFCDEQILEHYSEIGSATQMAILVHEMPFLSGYDGTQMHWPTSLLMSLPRIPQIVALKEDAKNFEITRAALELEPRIRIVIAGRKSAFVRYREYGARAYLNGISMLDARIGETFWRAYEADDRETIDFILRRLEAPFFDRSVSRYGWHRTNKALLQAAGWMHRRDRMPLKAIGDEQFKDVEQDYKVVSDAFQELLRR